MANVVITPGSRIALQLLAEKMDDSLDQLMAQRKSLYMSLGEKIPGYYANPTHDSYNNIFSNDVLELSASVKSLAYKLKQNTHAEDSEEWGHKEYHPNIS